MDRNRTQADEKASRGAAIRDASLAWRADINFLAGIIKRRYPTVAYLSDIRREPLALRRREEMESLADGIANFVGFQLILGFIFGIYLAPSIVAVVRGHQQWPWIGFLNFAAGWTVAGA